MRTHHLLAMACLVGAAAAACMENEALRVDGGALDGGGGMAVGGNSVGGKGGGAGGSAGGSGGSSSGSGGSSGGGGSGGGGAGGQAGKGGSGGAVMCPPVCDIFCANGNVRDANGCATCRCNPPPACQPVTCKLGCPNGFKKDDKGCEICECNPPPSCTKESCGPAPAPNYICPNGTTAGPVCTADANGKCTWKIADCANVCPAVACANFCPNGHLKDSRGCETCACAPAPPSGACAGYGDFPSCSKDPACQWLIPGCGEPALAAQGCYARSDIGCGSTGVCSAGKSCVKRVIDPCGGGPLGGPRCAACGLIETICL